MTAAGSTWLPPGRGTWVQLADHFPGPVTPQYAEVFIETMPPANQTLATRYGIPMKGLDAAVVNGYLYLHPVPLVGERAPFAPPPAALRLGARVHPALRACDRAAKAALRERPWRSVAAEWQQRSRAVWIEHNLALQRVVVEELDDRSLAAHLRHTMRAWRDGYRLHFELHGSDQLPIAAYVVRCTQWGIDQSTALAALQGWSPASRGDDELLTRVRAAVRRALATAPRSISSLDDIRSLGADVAVALDAYLEVHGWRLVTGYDLDGRTLRELPAVVLGRILAELPVGGAMHAPTGADGSTDTERADRSDRAADQVRAAVPAHDREELERLLDDARITYGLRDDNGAILGAWPVGLVRRAYLACAERLVARGSLDAHDDVFVLYAREIGQLLDAATADGARERQLAALAARRRDARAAAAAANAPLALGPPMALPDASVLPPAMALLTAAQLLLASDTGLTDSTRVVDVDAGELVGTGVGSGVVCGRVRVVDDAATALAEVDAGDILVTRSTNPAWNAVLPLARALVVEEGGLLSHAAIISRELALPAVIGVPGATSVLRTGDVVEVDPVAGAVRRQPADATSRAQR